LSNISYCYNHLGEEGNCIHFASEAIGMKVKNRNLNIKAYLRRAYAYESL